MQWLENAANDGYPCYPMFERDPSLDGIRADPQFIALMARLRQDWERRKATL